MSSRPRHPNKELERLLTEAEAKGWRIAKGKRYYRMRCPCGSHQTWIHLTPSDPNHERNKRAWLARTGCWEEPA